MRPSALALVCSVAPLLACFASAACGTQPARPVAGVAARPSPVRPARRVLPPPPRPPPPAATPRRAGETALPDALVRPRLVGLVPVGNGWAAAIEESPPTGERVVMRAPEEPSRDVAPSVVLAPPIGFALDVVGDTLVLAGEPPDDHVYARALADTAPRAIATLPAGLFTRVSTRISVAPRGAELGGVVVARQPDEEVHPFARPHRVVLEHLTAWSLGGAPRRPTELPIGATDAIAWLATAADANESAVVRVLAPRAPTETLDRAAGAVVRVLRLGPDGTTRSHAEAPAPADVTLDAIAALAPDGTLAVALLDAHDVAQALVVLPFGARGAGRPVALDAPGPLHDGDARLAVCGDALYAWSVSTAGDAIELAEQQVLPSLAPRDVVWRGEAHGAEGHVLAVVCNGSARVAALQRAPILANGSLVYARSDGSVSVPGRSPTP